MGSVRYTLAVLLTFRRRFIPLHALGALQGEVGNLPCHWFHRLVLCCLKFRLITFRGKGGGLMNLFTGVFVNS